MPALQTLLSKGRMTPLGEGFFSYLFALFNLSSDSAQDLPVAPLSALGDGVDASSGWWLHADPVHMVADRDQLYLSACHAIGLTQGEADELVEELNQLYAEDGWRFVVSTPQRWYLRLPQSLAMRTVPTAAAIGHRVGEVLPQGDDALVWQRSMTEIQMLLHASAVNVRRNEAGLLTVNSLWFWGGGELPQASGEPAWERVVADDPLVLGLARLHDVEVALPAEALLASLAGEKRVLWQANIDSLEQVEMTLFSPLLSMLRAGELSEVVIALPGIGRWHIDRAALRRWWRRRKALTSLLAGAA